MALGAMGRPTNPHDLNQSIAALRKAILDRDPSVAIWAQVALMAVDQVTDKGLDQVVKHLKGKDISTKVTAARALGAMGREAKPKVNELADTLLKESDALVIATTLDVLGGLGTTAGSTTGKIKEFSEKIDQKHKDIPKDQRESLKEIAKWAIEQIEGAPKKK